MRSECFQLKLMFPELARHAHEIKQGRILTLSYEESIAEC